MAPQCLVAEPETQTLASKSIRQKSPPPLPPPCSTQRGVDYRIIYLWNYHRGMNSAGSLQFVCPHCLAADAIQYTLKCLVGSFKKEPHSRALPPAHSPTHVSTFCRSDIITRGEISQGFPLCVCMLEAMKILY